VIDPLGRLSSSHYDRLDRVVKTTAPDPDGKSPLLAETTFSAYDGVGNLVSQTNGAGETERFAYDSRSQLVWSADGRGDETIRRYDAAGNLSHLVDPAGNRTTYAYDGLDRLTTETTAAGVRTREYNVLEQLAYATDRNGRATRYSYDRLDRKIQERWFADRTTAGLANPTAADFSDQLQWLYDELGRLEEDRLIHNTPAGGLDYRVTRSYVYDGLDRLTESSNQSIYNNTSFRSATASGQPTPAVRQTYAYAYDSSGLVETREQFIAGLFAASARSTYNAFGELARREEKDVDAASVASSILDFATREAAFTYDPSGALIQSNRSMAGLNPLAKTHSFYGYDGAGRLASLEHGLGYYGGSSYETILRFDYSYDLATRIGSIATDWATWDPALSGRLDETQSFMYDAAGQLKIVDSNLSDGDATYNYNANGNRSSANEPVGGSDTYSTANNRVSQDSVYSYVYDAEGNLFERRHLSGNIINERYTWDHRNRLTKVERHDVTGVLAETSSYRYNAADDLVYRSVDPAGSPPAVVEHYIVESGQRTMTFEQDGDVKRRYQYGPTGEVLFDQVFDATGSQGLQGEQDLLLPLGDHQHSTRLVVGPAASGGSLEIRQSLDYAQFGRVTAIRDAAGALVQDGQGNPDLSALDTVFAHHGSMLDGTTGLQLKAARWYSPDLGRFVSEDPIQDGTNWYMAFGNDPVNYADPSGLYQQGHPLKGGSSQLDGFLRGAVNQALNPAHSAPTPLYSQRFLNELGPIAAANQQTQMQSNFAAARGELAEATSDWNRNQYTVGPINRALAAAGAGIRSAGNAVGSGIEYATSGYGGTLGNVVAGAGGYAAQMWRTAGDIGGSIVDVPRTFEATLEDVRQTVQTGQQYGFRTAAARQVGLLAGAEAIYGTDVMTHQEVDPWSKTSEAFGRFGGTVGTAAGIGRFLSPKLPIAPSNELQFTFRGDPGEISRVFNEGIRAKGTSTDLLAHALDSSNPPSAFVPTSKSHGVAQWYNPNQVYVVRPTGGIDVNSTLGRMSPYPNDVEVAIPNWIAPQNIRAVTLPNKGMSVLNPNYKP
jgi:RHS repeat-associated protein